MHVELTDFKCFIGQKYFSNCILRVATVRERYLENEIFSISENFVDDQENLERTSKVREKSESLKINGYSRQASENLFILFKRGKDIHSHEIV